LNVSYSLEPINDARKGFYNLIAVTIIRKWGEKLSRGDVVRAAVERGLCKSENIKRMTRVLREKADIYDKTLPKCKGKDFKEVYMLTLRDYIRK